MGFLRNTVFKSKASSRQIASSSAAPHSMSISSPTSQNFDYGSSIPPWMNSYADLRTVEVQPIIHAARDGYYDREKRGFAALQTFGSTTWVPSDAELSKKHGIETDDISLRSNSTADSVSIDLPDRQADTRRGLRKRAFRSRRHDPDEYDDYSMPDWGVPDEYAVARRRFWH